jgi:hypothetical protein
MNIFYDANWVGGGLSAMRCSKFDSGVNQFCYTHYFWHPHLYLAPSQGEEVSQVLTAKNA